MFFTSLFSRRPRTYFWHVTKSCSILFIFLFSRRQSTVSERVRTNATWTSMDTIKDIIMGIIKDHRTTTIWTSTMATTQWTNMGRIINTISTSMFCLLTRSQKQPSGSDFWSKKFYERMRFISSVVIFCSYRRCLLKLLLSRQTPTQLTVPFDSSVLEGAFAGVNIILSQYTYQRETVGDLSFSLNYTDINMH